MPDWLVVFFIAASPLAELRGSLPVAVLGLKMPLESALFWSVLGNSLPVFLVYGFGDIWLRWVEKRRGFFHRLTDRVLGRTRHAFKDKYLKYGLLALPFFVALPLPLTGAWSGALAAFLFGIPFKKALPLIVLGVLGAAVIVTLALTGAVAAFRVFI